MIMLSRDIVAVDSAAAKALGGAIESFGYIAKGEELGLGRSDLSKLSLRRLTM
jgi:hypothetical protein